jgi:hypothetical protein
VSTVLDTPLFLGPILSVFSFLGVQKITHKNSEGQKLIKVSDICVTTLLLCRACVRVRDGKKDSNLLLSKLRDLPRPVTVSCVRVRDGKSDSNPLLSKLHDLPRRVVCSGVFVVRTQKSIAKVFVVRFVRSPDCSLTGHPL